MREPEDSRHHGPPVLKSGTATFRLYAPDAEAVEVCLFAPDHASQEVRRESLAPETDGAWATVVDGLRPGDLYGFRVRGPWSPREGHRFDASKLLVDPRAAALGGELIWHEALFSAETGDPDQPLTGLDSAPFVPKGILQQGDFDWQGVTRPRTPWQETVIYECHVRGMTRLHPEVPEELRGTYLGLIQPPVVEHLKRLGVTALELMPVQHFASERSLVERGLTNYFGYNPLAFFAPHAGFASGGPGSQIEEFKTMVRELHRQGIEVLLDVVFNHTAEGGNGGPTLSWRGIANRRYYRLSPPDGAYLDVTGCGNSLDFGSEATLELVLDSLRYWVVEMGVDGFRFDLAAALGRESEDFSPSAPLFRRIADDPVLRGTKLIAEPWDLGPDGHRLGDFPDCWSEWNDRFRDTLRSFWRGDRVPQKLVVEAMTGSRSLFAAKRHGPAAGVNLVTSHDGFTLRDLVSYERKHNLANGEENRDGHDHNLSRNWGIEGATEDDAVLALRRRASRNLLIGLALSAGTPMISHGDELGRSQQGNNNAYCHDSRLTWLDWEQTEEDFGLADLLASLLSLRCRLRTLRNDRFPAADQLALIHPEGRLLAPTDATEEPVRCFGLLFSEAEIRVAVLMSAEPVHRLFRLPPTGADGPWQLVASSASGPVPRPVTGSALRLLPYSSAVLRSTESSASASSR